MMRNGGTKRLFAFPVVLLLWLAGCEEKIKPSVLPGIDSKSIPQQESWNSTIVLSDSGKLKAVIFAGYIQKYDTPSETWLRQGVKVYFYGDSAKHTSTLTSDEGRVDGLTNNLDASGHVVVLSDDSTRLRSQKLFWDHATQRIHTPEYVFITSPREQVQGKGFESDQQLRNYRIFRVTGQAKSE